MSEASPEHAIQVRPVADKHQATCTCGYGSMLVHGRQKAFKLGRAHVAYHLKKQGSVL